MKCLSSWHVAFRVKRGEAYILLAAYWASIGSAVDFDVGADLVFCTWGDM